MGIQEKIGKIIDEKFAKNALKAASLKENLSKFLNEEIEEEALMPELNDIFVELEKKTGGNVNEI